MADDAEWSALRRALGAPAWALDPVFDTASGRSEHADRLDASLGSWVADRSQKEALAVLQSAGVGCEPVVHSYDVDLDGQMNARAFWEEVDHPVVGPKRFPGWPMQYGGRSGPWFRRAAPLLGQHNDEVLGALGISAEEREALRANGIIGTRPGGL
jgi:crotonobetainyl-CoA:carnitine CoA-transferase CaiB-like acyl-CoA transferase